MDSKNTIIETRNLSFAIGKTQILKDVSLSVPRGSVYGFLGPNGAGKTTLIRIMLNLFSAGSESVFLFGKDVTRNRVEVLSRVGRFVEQPSLYDHLTGAQNLRVTQTYYGVSPSRVGEVLSLVGMTEYANRKVKAYSLGMRQRVAIAQALIHDPELLILDEPTNGLDPSGIREIRELMVSLNRDHGKTIFVSSHNLSEIEKMCTHVGVIHHGQILYQGSMERIPSANENTLEIKVKDPVNVIKLLKEQGLEATHNHNSTITLTVSGEKQIAAINRYLVEKGTDVFSLTTHQNNLEDIFIALTNDNQ
ncbi:MAG TPA: ABC transporter ATP-binding protein [Bacteroidales bacterium]|nr:ABC transporter ATP-binding protein [Bacteroidales bacterium]HPT11326.1 ABC transporter ATP-binding protein [Bacteroidales bacterium]